MKHDLSDLPLFAWAATRGEIIAFPGDRMTGQARIVAAAVHRRRFSPDMDSEYWKQVVSRFRGNLERAGFDAGEIDRQFARFDALVGQELARLRLADRADAR